MIIHFIGSARNIDVDMPYIEKIFEIVTQNGGRIIRDWPHAAYARYKHMSLPDEEVDWHDVFIENIAAIKQAEFVIVEASTYSFNQGFYLNEALRADKPTLLLTRNPLRSRSVSGIEHPLLAKHQYQDMNQLEKLTNTFLRECRQRKKPRDITLSGEIQLKLSILAQKTGKTEEEILEEFIRTQS